MGDQIIQLVTILFVLSMVCERIADFLKHYLCGNKILNIGDTITKAPPEDNREKARYYRILKINVWCGILTALILKADLIKMFNAVKDAGTTVGWENINSYTGLDKVFLPFGIILTGCFISFGSKFWHDLLDILLEIKNAKRTINQLNSQQVNDPLDFNNLTVKEKDFILGSAIQTFAKHWEATISNYKRVDAGKKIINGLPTGNLALRFYVSTKDAKSNLATAVPEFIYYSGFRIPTDVITDTGKFQFHNWKNAGDGTIPVLPGKSISRENNTATGTISLKVKKEINGIEKQFVLSCFHVLFDNEFSNGKTNIPPGGQVSDAGNVKIPGDAISTDGTLIGKVSWGQIDEFVDAGVAELDNDFFITENIDGLGTPKSIYTVTTDDEEKLKLSFCGAKSGLVTGIPVKGCHATKEVDLPMGSKITFTDLIQVRKSADAGDSGAPVVDEHGRLVGIIEGSDDQFTYIIPIQNIINRIKINLI